LSRFGVAPPATPLYKSNRPPKHPPRPSHTSSLSDRHLPLPLLGSTGRGRVPPRFEYCFSLMHSPDRASSRNPRFEY
jgi:hypothetical protein